MGDVKSSSFFLDSKESYKVLRQKSLQKTYMVKEDRSEGVTKRCSVKNLFLRIL